jgi:hypothetical protein
MLFFFDCYAWGQSSGESHPHTECLPQQHGQAQGRLISDTAMPRYVLGGGGYDSRGERSAAWQKHGLCCFSAPPPKKKKSTKIKKIYFLLRSKTRKDRLADVAVSVIRGFV